MTIVIQTEPIKDNERLIIYPGGQVQRNDITKYSGGIAFDNKALFLKNNGRLIDADELIKDRVSNDNVVIHAKSAKTIIPADPENTA